LLGTIPGQCGYGEAAATLDRLQEAYQAAIERQQELQAEIANPIEDSIVRMVARLTRKKPSKPTLIALASALNYGSSGSRHTKKRA
jgi:hypothetical protein